MTTRNRSTTPTRLTLACLATLALTACTPNSPKAGQPDATAPTTPSTSTSAPPSTPQPSGPPDRPQAAEGLTLSAAEAFIRYYSDLMNYASDTGDSTALLNASEPGCENCKAYADFVKKSSAANGLLTGDFHEHLKEVSELVRGPSGRLGGSATVTVGKYVSRQTPTAPPFTSKPRTYTRELALSPQSGSWVMYEMKQVEQ
ncbi:hypothetical protein EV138_2521 [Kribbella voronezhensis]|uniref:DUF6318 domain-containing protein n=1 Tax=Kribbella voronezhensis TaxID=2512212 RepID=A0A4R7TC91_9ACTN|nr:DUF6318 family protein [Kribbella voronezhensis]TDU88968.1 hypothetical protein EV138_2521 [Kribbella voronezhensis]